LRPEEKIFAVWPEPPPDTHLHIFVELPTDGKCKWLLSVRSRRFEWLQF
jgi:hypothetical protein